MNISDISFAIIFSTVLILLLIAAVIIVIVLAGRQKAKQQVHLATMRLNYEKELRIAECEVQETTMNGISRELHDNIGQLLTVMKLQIESSKVGGSVSDDLVSSLDDTLTHVHQQLRAVGKALGADHLNQAGLLAAVEKEVEKIGALRICRTELETDRVEPVLNSDERLMAFRIFQELLQNTIKHAEASVITVKLNGQKNFLLSVADNGKGFNYRQELASGTGAGIRNVLKRAAMANFSCDIVSALGSGTTTIITKRDNGHIH